MNKERRLAKRRAWAAANPDKVRASRRKHYAANKVKIVAAALEYRRNKPEVHRAAMKRYYRRNKRQYFAYSKARARRARMQRPPWADKKAILRFYKNCPVGFHVDHIIPLKGKTVSGLHVETNLQYLPAQENLRKHNRLAA